MHHFWDEMDVYPANLPILLHNQVRVWLGCAHLALKSQIRQEWPSQIHLVVATA